MLCFTEENSCAVFKAGSCIHRILVSIISELKTFSVLDRTTSENEEITALCDWRGHFFFCKTKTDINYTAVSRTQVSFTPMSDVKCLDGNFTLKDNGHGKFTCIETSEKNRSKSTDNVNKHRRNKAVTVKDDHKPLQKDTQWNYVHIVILGVVAIVVLVAVGPTVYIVYKCRK